MAVSKKLILGWFTFTCCGDSTIIMTEVLNNYWSQWKDHLDFKYARVLRQSVPLGPMDIAFVEGAISSDKQAEELKQIRRLAQILVAVGSCAVTGQPSSQRNLFNQEQRKQIQPVLERFKYADTVKKVADVVKVDYSLPGCPMDEEKFIELVNQLCTKLI